MKTFFSLIVGIVFAVLTALLVTIYWAIGVSARLASWIVAPLNRLFSRR